MRTWHVQVKLQGGTIEAGDWVIWIRADGHTNCSTALEAHSRLALPPPPSDGSNTNASVSGDLSTTPGSNVDLGGLVYDKGGEDFRVDVRLPGKEDGPVDPIPFDGVQSLHRPRSEARDHLLFQPPTRTLLHG